jgi:AcrR family transcriptional regulator
VGLREDKKEAIRRRLYESAMARFREHGFAETRIRDVIDDVGVSEATFFNYFPTKEAVLHQSSAETKRFYGAYLHNLVARDTEGAADRLRELAGVVASTFARDREFMATVLAHTDLFFSPSGETNALDVENSHLLAELFRQGQARAEFDAEQDPVQLAEIFNAVQLLTTLNWVNRWWGETTEDLDGRLRRAIDVVLSGARRQSSRRRSRATSPS